jgi:nanoRNase/pAp phosphatase (c-di-AMP/oligoRNAs hydrolase)
MYRACNTIRTEKVVYKYLGIHTDTYRYTHTHTHTYTHLTITMKNKKDATNLRKINKGMIEPMKEMGKFVIIMY